MLLYFYLKILVIHHSTVQVIVTDSHDSHSSILWCQLFNKVTLWSDVQFHQTTKCSSVDDPLYTLCYASQNTVVVTIQDIQHQLRIKLYPVKTGTVPHLSTSIFKWHFKPIYCKRCCSSGLKITERTQMFVLPSMSEKNLEPRQKESG